MSLAILTKLIELITSNYCDGILNHYSGNQCHDEDEDIDFHNKSRTNYFPIVPITDSIHNEPLFAQELLI